MSKEVLFPTEIKSCQQFEFNIAEYNLLRLLEPNMPKDAKNIKVLIDIPRGGDYSGMTLELKECDLRVRYDLES